MQDPLMGAVMDFGFTTWDWSTISKTIVGAGIGTAAVQGALSLLKDARERKFHAAYVALRIAVALETFADGCLDVIGDKELAESSRGSAGGVTIDLPDAPIYPADDGGWRSLQPALAERALTLPGKLSSAQRSVSFMFDVADYDSAVEACCEACARLGNEALDLAGELRRAYKFPTFKMRGAEKLRSTAGEIEARRS